MFNIACFYNNISFFFVLYWYSKIVKETHNHNSYRLSHICVTHYTSLYELLHKILITINFFYSIQVVTIQLGFSPAYFLISAFTCLFQIIISFLNSFITNISFVFGIYRKFSSAFYVKSDEDIILILLMWAIYYNVFMLIIVIIGQKIHLEVKVKRQC